MTFALHKVLTFARADRIPPVGLDRTRDDPGTPFPPGRLAMCIKKKARTPVAE